jgi:hypothetical protein
MRWNMNQKNFADRDPVAQQLRAEAEAGMVPFSQSLHQRVMHDLQNARMLPANPVRRRFWPVPALAAAAAILIGVLVERDVMVHQPLVNPSVPELNFPLNALANAVSPIEDRLIQARFGYVDQDARRLARFVVNQLDVLPMGDRSPVQSSSHRSS